MTFLNNIMALVASMRPIWSYALNYAFALAFLATAPCIIRHIWRK